MATWMNNDGLYLKYGTTKAVPNTGGDYVSYGNNREAEFTLNLTNLGSTSAIQNDTFFFPANTFIEEVQIVAETPATSGGSATLSVGLYKSDRSTALSETALVSALALTAIDGQGEKTVLTLGSTGAGAYVGTNTGTDTGGYYISAKYGTAAFTAGVIKLRVKYHMTGTITQ